MKLKHKYIYSALLIFFLFSCKKDKLEGDKSILEGKWKWEYTLIQKESIDDPDYPYATYYASDAQEEYYIEFDRKGFVRMIKSNDVEKCYRLVFTTFVESNEYWLNNFRFNCKLDNKEDKPFRGKGTLDSLLVNESNAPIKQQMGDLSVTHFYSRCP